MEIISFQFFGFCLLILVLYYVLPFKLQNYLLIISTYAFLVFWSPYLALVYFCLTTATFLIARQVAPGRKSNRLMIISGILINVITLAYLKYASFFVPELTLLLKAIGLPAAAGGLQLLVPVGLSFLILQSISYLLDIQSGSLKHVGSFGTFALYLAYFPKIVSGPIERAGVFITRLENRRSLDDAGISIGVGFILVGLFRKVVLANLLTLLLPKDIFDKPTGYAAPELVVALVVYAFTLYNDFAGYTSVVRGISRLFGIELSSNFNTPYFSQTFAGFWQHWHISLSEWLRDYIYTPLTRASLRRFGNQSLISIVVPPLVTMLVSGLWHGAALNLLLWGAMHGVYQAIERLITLRTKRIPPHLIPGWQKGLSILMVFVLVLLTYIPFRMDLSTAGSFVSSILDSRHWVLIPGNTHLVYAGIFSLLATALAMDIFEYWWGEIALYSWRQVPGVALATFAIFVIFLALATGKGTSVRFIYQGF